MAIVVEPIPPEIPPTAIILFLEPLADYKKQPVI